MISKVDRVDLTVKSGQFRDIILGMSRKNPMLLRFHLNSYCFTKLPQFRLFPTHDWRASFFTHNSMQKQHIFRSMIVIFCQRESCHTAYYYSQFHSILTEPDAASVTPKRERASCQHFKQTAELNLVIKRTGETQRIILLKDLSVPLKDRLLGFHSIWRQYISKAYTVRWCGNHSIVQIRRSVSVLSLPLSHQQRITLRGRRQNAHPRRRIESQLRRSSKKRREASEREGGIVERPVWLHPRARIRPIQRRSEGLRVGRRGFQVAFGAL